MGETNRGSNDSGTLQTQYHVMYHFLVTAAACVLEKNHFFVHTQEPVNMSGRETRFFILLMVCVDVSEANMCASSVPI